MRATIRAGGGSRPLRTASRRAAMEAGPCAASFMWFARGGRRGAEGAAQVGLARSDVGHGVARQERVLKAISGFQSRESYRQPPALMKRMPQVGPVEGDPLFRLPATTPRRGFFSAAGFFLACGGAGTASGVVVLGGGGGRGLPPCPPGPPLAPPGAGLFLVGPLGTPPGGP